MFISLEGIDGSGKTTQAKRLANALSEGALLLREPGGTVVNEVIRPRREAGEDVVCDRFSDSSVAYQGVARGLGVERVEHLCDLATGGLWPDLTLLLRLHPEVAAERIAAEGRAADRFEGEGMVLQRLVAEGYEAMASRHPRRIRVIDASADPDTVHAAVMAEVSARRGSVRA